MIKDTVEKVKRLISRRSHSYKNVFDMANLDARFVLEDLARFCRAHETTFHADPRKHAALEGRREVWIRIEQLSKLSEKEILDLHSIRVAQKGE